MMYFTFSCDPKCVRKDSVMVGSSWSIKNDHCWNLGLLEWDAFISGSFVIVRRGGG